MKEKLFEFAVRRPLLVIFLTVLFVIGAAYGGSKLTFKSDYRVFFGEDNPELQAYEKVQATFTKNDNVAFVVAPKDGQVFTETTLEAIHKLTEMSWQIPYSSRVDSITNYQHTVAEEDDLIVEDLVLEREMLPELDLEKIKQIAVTEPLLVNKLISEDASTTMVGVTIHLPGINEVTELPEVVASVRDIRDQVLAEYPELDIYLSGVVLLNNAFSEAALNDNATFIPAMFAIVAITMVFLLRTFTGGISTIFIVMFSILSTMGLAGWMGYYLTGPSASAPTVILTLAVADCVHILATMMYEMRHGTEKRQAILDSLKINFQPILLTSLTTAVGFLSMNFSDSPPFHDLGNLVAIGVMLAFVFSITVFPALLMVLPLKVKLESERKADFMDKISHFVIEKRRSLLPTFAVIIVALCVFIPQNVLNDDFVKYFDKSVDFRQATDFMQERISGIGSIEVELSSGTSGGISNPDYLKTMDEFNKWIRAQAETDHTNMISDIFLRLNKNMHGDDPSYYRLPEDRELAAQYLLLYEMSLPYGLDLNNQLDVDKTATRMVITVKNITSEEYLMLEQRIKAWFVSNAPQFEATIASPSLMFAHIGQRNIYSMLTGTTLALILISVMLGFALRSVKFGLISLIPNLAPAGMAFGIWYFLDGEVGLGLSVVVGMTLGIVVDDTVHFLSKYIYARRNKNKDSIDAVRYAFNSVGRALWITTLVLVAGFMVLAQSSFKLNADMGLLTAMTIVLALVVDFLFLPPLLMKLDNDKNTAMTTQAMTTKES
ncbi:RND family transporter [Marinomonas agarivorans]|nr:RND family transporter [Marinomonas agarivorans]